MFIFEDNLSSISRAIGKGSVSDDIKLAIQNKVVTGKTGTKVMFSSKMYEKNYFFIGIGKR